MVGLVFGFVWFLSVLAAGYFLIAVIERWARWPECERCGQALSKDKLGPYCVNHGSQSSARLVRPPYFLVAVGVLLVAGGSALVVMFSMNRLLTGG